MLKLLEGFPDSVVAVTASGRITRHDYENILIPKVQEAFRKFPKLRIYYEIGSEFSGVDAGAAWDDFMLGMEHLRSWERIAVVTDVESIRWAVAAFQFIVPGQVRVFNLSDTGVARKWITPE